MSKLSAKQPVPMGNAGERLGRLISQIIRHWEKRVRKELPAAKQQDPIILYDGLPEFLLNLVRTLSPAHTQPVTLSTLKLAEQHGKQRAKLSEYSLSQVLLEYRLLRQSIIEVLTSEGPISNEEREIIQDTIDRGIAEAGVAFMDAKLSREKKEKQYMELLTQISTHMPAGHHERNKRLENLITRLMEGMEGVVAIILFYSQSKNEIINSVSVGISHSLTEAFKKAILTSRFLQRIIASQQFLILVDINELEDEQVETSLKKQEIQSLLGFRLKPSGDLTEILFLGFKVTRHFDPYEIELLEDVAIRIGLILENLRLYDQSIEDLENLKKEKDLREQFIFTLSHDLRTPLTAAKLSAQSLFNDTHNLETRNKLYLLLSENIQRIDRMIQDLLDSNRVRSGQKLSLHVKFCDLRKLAESTIADISVIYGNRFLFISPDSVPGYWDNDFIRRVIENLIQNAIKYGHSDTTVTITLTQEQDKTLIRVHNEGSPIPAEQQAILFEPFRRIVWPNQKYAKGWGLGLTLVRGVAEAHGGSVEVYSSIEEGTTFTVILPNDSRLIRP